MLTIDETRTRGTATDAQRRELRQLIADRAVDPQWKRRFFGSVRAAEGLARSAADDALVYLRSLAPAGHRPALATAEQATALNTLTRSRIIPARIRRVWLGRLHAGELPYDLADRTILEWLRLPRKPFIDPAEIRDAGGAPDGYYALITPDGTPRWFRVHTYTATGGRIVEQITGERASQRRKLRGVKAAEVLNAVALNPAEAAALYGATRKRCAACNVELRRPDQPGYAHGYGPDCWKKLHPPDASTTHPGPGRDTGDDHARR